MKKIGIMSMQRIYNYGSFLQAYGLKKLIEGLDEKNEVSFIDYKPGTPLIHSGSENSTHVQRILKKIKEYNDVDANIVNKLRFFNHKRTYAKRFFPVLGVTTYINEDTSDLDYLVIGSDEVFNCVQSNTNVGYSRDLFGYNTSAQNVISYAGSFGNTTLDKIEKYGIRKELTEDFSKFKKVSVRDGNSIEIVKALGVEKPILSIDPALAFDYMTEEPMIPKERLFKEKYMIVYGYSGRLTKEENETLSNYAATNQLKILCFGGVQGCCDKFIDCTPFELLAYFRDAEAIVTDTFHGTIFSIINKKSFSTIIRKSVGNSYGNEEKLGFLLELFDLSSQKIEKLDIDSISESLSMKIEYDKVFFELEKRRKESREYLRQSIK